MKKLLRALLTLAVLSAALCVTAASRKVEKKSLKKI